ncbi:Predicted ABC-type sugar transport system, permease component [Serratia proteamaculans]|nr:Predicted ABC-type sugar transport system, permease component [Serratia proteamaculans]
MIVCNSITSKALIGLLTSGLVMMSVSKFWRMAIKRIVIIVAVIIAQMQNRMQQKAAEGSSGSKEGDDGGEIVPLTLTLPLGVW